MIKFITFFLILFNLNLFSQEVPYLTSRDHAVLLSVTVNEDNSITLDWQNNPLAQSYSVGRRLNREGEFLTVSNDLDNQTTTFTDNDIMPGLLYEYMVLAPSVGSIVTKIDDKDTTVAVGFYATGYITAGIDVDVKYEKGRVLLITEADLYEAIPDEIDRLKEDLRNEGWGVTFKQFGRTENFNKDSVKKVKDYILDEYDKNNNISSIFILGRIAVPYSGNIAPDGHKNHEGAWPADLYYGQLSKVSWTDMSVNKTSASREQNKNIPGDGKFDISVLSNFMDVKISVGRVDFYDMPLFISEETNEIQLYKNYLDKNHLFRTGQINTNYSGIVDDNFAAKRYTEGFASCGWRNIAAITGKDNVSKGDFISLLSTDPHLMAYGCGGGTYTSAGGIGNTENIASNDMNGVFVMLFGSYFGDWDVQNSFLRAPLATMPSVLTSCWAARPQWYMHHMNMGFPIGYATLIAQNNYDEYIPNAYQSGGQTQIATFGNRQVHTALLGDPTLTAYPYNEVLQPNNVVAYPLNKTDYKIDWEPSETDENVLYNIYRSNDEYGAYVRLNESPIDDNTFTDTDVLLDGTLYYMVKAAKPRVTNGGSYYQESIGSIASVLTDVKEVNSSNPITVGPIPATNHINISFIVDQNENVRSLLYDMNGNIISEIINDQFAIGKYEMKWNINSDLSSGVYLLRSYIGNNVYVNKIIINR